MSAQQPQDPAIKCDKTHASVCYNAYLSSATRIRLVRMVQHNPHEVGHTWRLREAAACWDVGDSSLLLPASAVSRARKKAASTAGSAAATRRAFAAVAGFGGLATAALGVAMVAAASLRDRFLLPAAGETAAGSRSPLLGGAALASAAAVGDVAAEVGVETALGRRNEAPAAWPAAVGELAGATCDCARPAMSYAYCCTRWMLRTQTQQVRHWCSLVRLKDLLVQQ
jgi:hypothetical protein